MIKLDEHLKEIHRVKEVFDNAKPGTPLRRDMGRRYRKLCQERSEALRYMREAGRAK